MTSRKIILFIFAAALGFVAYVAYVSYRIPAIDEQIPGIVPDMEDDVPSETADKDAVDYSDKAYGFEFALPDSWRGYTVVAGEWQGYAISDDGGQVLAAEGPQLSIRHPLWTETRLRQDIPIMILTLRQWEDLQADKFHVGAAPINPSELGRNNLYVFALPARYNYAFPEGYEEVEQILAADPLHPSDVSGAHLK